MEAQLKALKVPELKTILQKVGLSGTGKKDDLIARIIASPAAVAYFKPEAAGASAGPRAGAAGAPDDDLLAPPEEFDWGAGVSGGETATAAVPRTVATASTPAVPPATAVVGPPAPSRVTAPASSTSTDRKRSSPTTAVQPQAVSATESTAKAVDEDDEMAKRRARAARFGIPVVEPKKRVSKPTPGATGVQQGNTTDSDLEAKKAARADRFGVQNAGAKTRSPNSKPLLDPTEEDKKRKRAERFGLNKSEGSDTKKPKTG